MLILTRREGEEFVLTHKGITIRVKVTNVNGSQVKVGIEAPREVHVARNELPKQWHH